LRNDIIKRERPQVNSDSLVSNAISSARQSDESIQDAYSDFKKKKILLIQLVETTAKNILSGNIKISQLKAILVL
jgi:hypothetical protein